MTLMCAVIMVPMLNTDERSKAVIVVDITDAQLEEEGSGSLLNHGGGGGRTRDVF